MSTTITRACAWCGETFTAQRSDALYCKEAHRKAAARARAESSPPRVPPAGVEGECYRATLAELQEYGRHLSASGAVALQLASLLDGGATGQAAASLARAHDKALRSALEGATKDTGPDPLEILRRERAARLREIAGGAAS